MGGKASGPIARRVQDAEVRCALDAYVGRIQALFDDALVGVYLYGSVVCGDYRPGVSDVDVVVLHRCDLDDGQRRGLGELHERMGRYAGYDRIDASFVPLRLVGTYGEDALPYLRDGLLHQGGGGDLNMVTWRSLREHGVALCGAPPAGIMPPISDEDLLENMRRNLAFLSRRMPAYAASGVEETVFGVLSVCRVLHTLRTGGLIGKAAAARWALDNVEPGWRPLIRDAARRYENGNSPGAGATLRAQAPAFAYRAAKTAS